VFDGTGEPVHVDLQELDEERAEGADVQPA
jgi:hypothetical protein